MKIDRFMATLAARFNGWGDRLDAGFQRMEGFTVVVYFWGLVFSLCGGAVLLVVGLKLLNSWVFVLGLLSLRGFGYLCRVGERYLFHP